ncbi:restriction endonuclease subunit S [Alcanivorax jadensis]|jgi:type I restriction enzyme S subunit|uniref:restriction endonuclease subunit S n=1 Tax=Alcanivorax jadensis TaxID=64988 RepID=UPI00240A6D9F|nr:restriction endonuclease subunit S [Alcanivorax jadensis]MDF1639034.1 restriction endonuclease subunit S [Alcanivorax jadensis]
MEAEPLWDIPDNWSWSRVSDLGDVIAGGTPSSKEPKYWGGNVNWISPSDLTGHTKKTISKGNKSITEGGLRNSSAKVMPAGSIHFSSRAPIGYVAISAAPMATNQGFKSLVPQQGIFNEFVYYYLKSSKQLAEKRASGTTFLELSGKSFGLLQIPVPPTNEQKRIVAKIEELFSDLGNGIAALKTAREQLKVYREAVLKHAFEGKLTAKWRKDNCVPENSWQNATVKDLALLGPSNGRSVKDRAGGFPVLRLTALKNGKIDLNEFKEGAWDKDEAKNHIVNDGDFLFSRGNGSKHLVGRGGLVTNPTLDVAFPDTIMRIGLDKSKVTPSYFSYVWESRLIRTQIESSARTTAGIYKINQQHVKRFTLSLPSIAEQNVVTNIIEEKLSVVDAQLVELEQQLSKAEALRQSILKKAFSGHLVPQDPNDEPAGELLARIQAEREATKTKNTKKARKAK